MAEEKANKTPIYKKWWFWVIIVLILGCIGAAVGSSKNEPQKVGDSSSEQQGDKDSQKKDFNVGDVIAVEGLEISVLSVNRNWSSQYSKPKDGKEYVEVNVQITNKSDEKASYNFLNWKLENGDGAIEGLAVVLGDDDSLDSGELAKGGTKKGSIVFEVPKDDKNLKIHYLPNVFSDKNEVIINL